MFRRLLNIEPDPILTVFHAAGNDDSWTRSTHFYPIHPVYTKVVLLDVMRQLVVWLKPYTKLQRSISFPLQTGGIIITFVGNFWRRPPRRLVATAAVLFGDSYFLTSRMITRTRTLLRGRKKTVTRSAERIRSDCIKGHHPTAVVPKSSLSIYGYTVYIHI